MCKGSNFWVDFIAPVDDDVDADADVKKLMLILKRLMVAFCVLEIENESKDCRLTDLQTHRLQTHKFIVHACTKCFGFQEICLKCSWEWE